MVLLKALSVILYIVRCTFALEQNTLFYRLIADTTGIMANYEALIVS